MRMTGVPRTDVPPDAPHARAAAAHLLRLKPGSLPRDAHAGSAAGREVPTLEAFRAETDPDAFYSERELVALYVETCPPATSAALDRKVTRNRRLRNRPDAALARMEASLVEAPLPERAGGRVRGRVLERVEHEVRAGVARTPIRDAVRCCRCRSRRRTHSTSASTTCWSRSRSSRSNTAARRKAKNTQSSRASADAKQGI
ncbi:hypothetical protein [Burkholderia stabilis]|uniref:hypothetical protein n=1 Tax=Burkholderia stabilis TaxID=95485 RepID=UPI001FC89F38|nr:hypothetical protein [Burkholderia stabilis]